jgi:serine/threonine-protein kinase
MNPERPEQVAEIFHLALELASEQRASFLEVTCGEDLELRSEVESLLHAHQGAANFIEDSASDVAASLLKNQPLHPRQVGQYKIEKLLGAGGMGEVYLATDRLGRRVALKLLPSHLHKDPQHVARFLREAQTLLALNHPNIVTVYDIGEADGSYYIASELIEGENLREAFGSTDLDVHGVFEITIQVATGLAAAHEKGIVHRDIKPENVMVRHDGYVKVLDFGVAKLLENFAQPLNMEGPGRPKFNTSEGLVIGTATYMSPEQVRGIKVDERTDVWSCGVMLYEMLTRKSPFAAISLADIVVAVLDHEPSPLENYLQDVPSELQRIVSKALMKNREDRYQTIKDMLLDLKAFKQEMEFTAKLKRSASTGQSQTPTESGAVRTQREAVNTAGLLSKIKQRKLAVAILASALVLLIVGVGYWFSRTDGTTTSIESIAVMPFENVTHEQNSEYLSDGVTESLINSLSQLPHIKVIARNSVFTYKNQTVDLQQIARQLSVQAVLTGRVLMQGDTLDVHVALTDARNNTQIWGAHYTRRAADIFAVQDEIARQVTDALRVRLTGAQQEQVTKRYTDNAEAYRLYLQGRYYFNEASEGNLAKAVSYFDRAISLDPRFALAYAARANALFSMGDFSLPMKEAVARAREDATTALRIDSQMSEARLVLANIKFQYDWDFAGSDEDFKQVIALDPNYAEAHHEYMYYFAMTGNPSRALTEIDLAQQLDPVNPIIVVDTALPYYLSRQYEESSEQFRKGMEMFPSFYLPHMGLGLSLIAKGDVAAGIQELETGKSLEANPIVIGNLAVAYTRAGRQDEARKLLNDLKDESKTRYVAAYYIAIIYAGLGEKDQAFAWFEKAYQDRSWWLVWLKVDPLVDSLRSDERFNALIHRIGFPQ